VGLFQRVPQGLDFLAVLLLQPGDLAGQRENDGVLRVGGSGGRCWGCPSLGAQAFDASAQVGVVVEEGVGDAGLPLDGLEGDRLAALDEGADRLLGGLGLGLRLGLRGGGEGLWTWWPGNSATDPAVSSTTQPQQKSSLTF
jgi:hypothetical protein